MVDNVVNIEDKKIQRARVMCRAFISKFLCECVGEDLTSHEGVVMTEEHMREVIPMLPVLVGEAITAYALFGSFVGRHEGDAAKAIRELVEMLVDAQADFVEDVELLRENSEKLDAQENTEVRVHEFESKESLKDFLDDVMNDDADS